MSKITIGLIGVGDILSSHLQALKANPEFQLIGICRQSKEKLEHQANQLGVKGYTNYLELLSTKPDVVLISLPHHLHYQVTIDALNSGCHCLVEKPLAISLKEVNAIINLARSVKRTVLVTESSYWQPDCLVAKEIVQKGKLGKLLFGNFTNHRYYFTPSRPNWFLNSETSGGGQFINIGSHRVAAVRCILGDKLKETSVTASVHRIHPDHDIEAATKALVMYSNGEGISYEECGYLKPPDIYPCGLNFVFEKGILGIAGDHVWTSEKEGIITKYPANYDSEKTAYCHLYKQMLNAISGKEHYPTIYHSAKDVRIALAVYASAEQQRPIDLCSKEWEIVDSPD